MKWFLIVPAALYLLIVGVVYVFQRNLMYAPGHHMETPTHVGVSEMEAVSVETGDGLVIESWYAAGDPGKPTIVLFHGNAGTLDDRAFKARQFLDAGYGVALAGYRGFGRNPGKPDEQGLYSDARAILDHVDKIAPDETGIVLYGESLGSGVAVQMAYEAVIAPGSSWKRRMAGLILEAPFTSMADAAASHYPWLPARMLVWDRFDSIEKIGGVEAPLLVIHGRRDRTVPFRQGVSLFDAAPEPKQAVWLEEAGHVNVYDFGAADHILEWLGIHG